MNIMDSNAQPTISSVPQQPVQATQQMPHPHLPKRNMIVFLGICLIILFGLGLWIAFSALSSIPVNPPQSKEKQVIPQSQKPDTGDLYQDIKVRLKEEFK